MRERVDEHSAEYALLLNLLNAAIRATGTFKVTDYLRFLMQLQRDPNFRQQLEVVLHKAESAHHAEYCHIASKTFRVLGDMLQADTRTLRGIYLPTLVGVAVLLTLVKVTGLLPVVRKKMQFIDRANDDLSKISATFDHACCA